MNETVSIPEAAAELGITVDELFDQMRADGLVLDHPNGGHTVSPHPAIQQTNTGAATTVVHEPWLCTGWEQNGVLTLYSSVLVKDTNSELAEVLHRAEGRALVRDETTKNPNYLFGSVRIRVWW